METRPISSEETSSGFKPVTEFNIASAFPVTGELTRKIALAKWIMVSVIGTLILIALVRGCQGGF